MGNVDRWIPGIPSRPSRTVRGVRQTRGPADISVAALYVALSSGPLANSSFPLPWLSERCSRSWHVPGNFKLLFFPNLCSNLWYKVFNKFYLFTVYVRIKISNISWIINNVKKGERITHCVNVSTSCPRAAFIPECRFLRLPVNDNFQAKLLPHFDAACAFIG